MWLGFALALPVWVGWALWLAPAGDLRWPLHNPLGFLLPVMAYPILEEIVFRGGLQPALATRLKQHWGALTAASLLTSLLFTGFHFFFHPPLWAALVFIPSLVYGYFRERHDSLASPIALHVFYNAGYFWLFGV